MYRVSSPLVKYKNNIIFSTENVIIPLLTLQNPIIIIICITTHATWNMFALFYSSTFAKKIERATQIDKNLIFVLDVNLTCKSSKNLGWETLKPAVMWWVNFWKFQVNFLKQKRRNFSWASLETPSSHFIKKKWILTNKIHIDWIVYEIPYPAHECWFALEITDSSNENS